MLTRLLMVATVAAILGGCSSTNSVATAIREVNARPLVYSEYPEAGKTYLTFSGAHGFQVNYIRRGGTSWLWYPGNGVALPEEWRLDTARNALCWGHPKNSRNPVTGQSGGGFACQDLTLSRKTVIAELEGDRFNLSSGRVPYRRGKCEAPSEFSFDRNRFRC